MKRAIALAAFLLPWVCLAQTRLTTPVPANTQCVGSDCQRGQGDSSAQQGTPSRPNLTGAGESSSGEGATTDRTTNDRQQPNGELQAELANAAASRNALYPKTEFEKL